MTPESLVRTVEDFLTSAGDAVIIEDGAVVFDLAQSKYSISGERNKCLSHLWSEERNFVRRVLEAEVKNEILRLAVQRRGQAKPTKLEICRERDRRTPTAKLAARLAMLFLVAPAPHVHPATDTLLHYISPAIDWALLGIDEGWREGVRVVFRKRPERKMQMIKD